MFHTSADNMETLNQMHILEVLYAESHSLTFDELYRKAKTSCDWILFAAELEQLVEQGRVQYILPCGADAGCYKAK